MSFIEDVSSIAKFIKKDFGKIISKFPKKELSKEIKFKYVQHTSKVLEDTSIGRSIQAPRCPKKHSTIDVRIQNSDNFKYLEEIKKEYDDIQKTYINDEPQVLTDRSLSASISLEDYLKSRHLQYGENNVKKISNEILDDLDDEESP